MTDVATSSGRPTSEGSAASHVLVSATRYIVIASMLAVFAIFSLLRPDSFFTRLTIESIFRDCTPLFIVALGITLVLIVNEFDLSVGGLIALCATFVVMMMSGAYEGLSLWIALLLGLGLGAACGLFNGVLISYFSVPAIVLTIGMGTVYGGIGLLLTDSSPIYEEIPARFTTLISGETLGLSRHIFIGVALLLIVHVVLRHTTTGRYLYAIGGNVEAARLSGVRVNFLKTGTFVALGLTAALTGILLTSEAGAANPNTGLGLLLPAYAAAFLGSSMFRPGLFTPVGTALGAIYLQIIGTGLTILNLSGPIVQIVQGGILAGAVVLARFVRA